MIVALVRWGFVVGIFDFVQGVVSTIIGSLSSPAHATVPQVIIDAVEDLTIWDKIGVWAISLIGGLVLERILNQNVLSRETGT